MPAIAAGPSTIVPSPQAQDGEWSDLGGGLCGHGSREEDEDEQRRHREHREAPGQGQRERAERRLHVRETSMGPELFRVRVGIGPGFSGSGRAGLPAPPPADDIEHMFYYGRFA